MAYLEPHNAIKVISWAEENISPEDLTDDGIDHASHVTVLYGFDPSVTKDDLVPILSEYGPLTFRLGKISRFENDDYDVIKVEVISDDLNKLHHDLRKKMKDRVEITFPDYNAHLTLAYVKKGTCKELDGHHRFWGDIYRVDRLVYSSADSVRKDVLTVGKISESRKNLLKIVG